jgi:hypothetical protein
VADHGNIHVDVCYAVDEIEWLRAAKAEGVRRGDLVQMAEQLTQMKSAIAALLERIETALQPVDENAP